MGKQNRTEVGLDRGRLAQEPRQHWQGGAQARLGGHLLVGPGAQTTRLPGIQIHGWCHAKEKQV